MTVQRISTAISTTLEKFRFISPSLEAFPTFITYETLSARVDQLMAFQVLCTSEFFGTMRTTKGSRSRRGHLGFGSETQHMVRMLNVELHRETKLPPMPRPQKPHRRPLLSFVSKSEGSAETPPFQLITHYYR